MYLYNPGRRLRVKQSVTTVLITAAFFLFGNVFTVNGQAPTITSFTPDTVCQGNAITITGTNFTGATVVKLGTDNAGFKVNSATSISATVSNQSATGTITVTTPAGTVISAKPLNILPAPIPALIDISTKDAAFTNCNGDATYELIVSNGSVAAGGSSTYKINWGDNTAVFSQTDWPANAQTSHTYTAQGYFKISFTITPSNGCAKTVNYQFYNGANPLASLTTTNPTTGLCVPAPVEFQIGNWFNNSAGTLYELDFGDGSKDTTLSHPLNASNTIALVTHAYNTTSCPNSVDYTATLSAINGCFTTKYTLNQIIIRKKPIADFTGPATPSCINIPVCFSNNTVDGYSGNSCNSTSSFAWDFGDNTSSNDATPSCHVYAVPGTYTVTLTASNTACGGDTRTKTVTVLPTSPPPVVDATPISYCQGQTAVALTATGVGLLWYTTETGGTGSATAPVPSTNTAGTFTYYVSQARTNECESPRVSITITINAAPAAPVVNSPIQLCQNQAPTPLTATGTALLWYSNSTGGTGAATAPTPSTAAIGESTYYVSQTVNGCESPRASISVTVNLLAAAPVVTSPLTYCQNQSALPLTASGTGLLWYTAATGGTGVAIAPTPATNTVGSTIYYVSQVTGCGEGPRAAITVNIRESPSATIAYSKSNLCNVTNTVSTPNAPVPVTLTGTVAGNFTILPATGLSIDAASGTINPSGALAGNYTITYTIPGTNGCSDFTTTALVNVSGSPAATILYPALCTSDAVTAVQLTGAQGGGFTSSTGLTIDTLTGAITPATSTPGKYIVTYTILPSAPCPGFITTASVTITKAPSASINYNVTNVCNVVNTASTPNPPITVTLAGTPGGSYTITPSNGLPINAASGTIDPSGAVAGTYTVTYTIAGAGGCADFTTAATLVVSGSPTAAISYAGPVCSSDASASVQLTGTPGGIFSASPGLTIDPATGTITPGTSTPGNYVITYTIPASPPCPGFTTSANIIITKAPSASIAYAPFNLCNVINTISTPNLPVKVTQNGTAGGVYSIAPNAGLMIDAVTGTLDPSGAAPGQYTISYSLPASGGCSDYATTAIVTVSGAPTAAISYPGSPFCRGINTPQPVTSSGTSGGSFSAAAGLSINNSTGEINPASSTPGTYTVTYTIAASAPCPGFVATASVEIDDSPVLTFPVSSQSICSGGTAAFAPSSTVANTTYAWSVMGSLPENVAGVASGTSSGANPSIQVSFTNTGMVSQTITIQVIPTNPSQNPCAGAPYNLTVIVNPVPAALTSDTVNLCMGTTAAPLTANPLPGNTIKWYDQNQALLNAAPVISTAVPNSFTYYVSQTNSFGCESLKSMTAVVVNPTAKIISATFTNPTTCGIPSGSIVLNVLDLNNNPIPDIPLIVHYDKFQTAYQVADSTDASGKITVPLVAGTYSGIYVETYGCLSQKIPNVFVLKDPDPPAQPVAGYNPPLCSETPLNLTAISATSTQAGPIDYVWVGPAFGAFADTSKNTSVSFPSAAVSDAGTYIVYAIQNNCISPATSFQVVIRQSPSKPQINTRTPLCTGDALTLQAYSSIGLPGATLNYSWTGPGSGFPVNAPNAAINKVKISDAGLYVITVNSPQTGCSSSSDTLVQVGAYPVVKFAQDSLTLPTGFLLNLSPVLTNAADAGVLPMKSYEWTPSQDLACNDAICSSPVATIKNDICYTVKATNIYGCSGSDVICVKVFCQGSQVFVPNAFTPRGDLASNRKLMVRASGINSVKSFRVFNRWGRLVFERNNFPPNNADFGWDGTVNGKLSDPGVYVYTTEVICENGVPYFFKGNVTLL